MELMGEGEKMLNKAYEDQYGLHCYLPTFYHWLIARLRLVRVHLENVKTRVLCRETIYKAS